MIKTIFKASPLLAILLLVSTNVLAEQYIVQSGDFLWDIAKQARDDSIHTEQMLIAIYQKNPSAFGYANINSLKERAVLELPTSQQAANIPQKKAKALFFQHVADWNNGIKHKLASNGKTAHSTRNKNNTKKLIEELKQQINAVKIEIQQVIVNIKASQDSLNNEVITVSDSTLGAKPVSPNDDMVKITPDD